MSTNKKNPPAAKANATKTSATKTSTKKKAASADSKQKRTRDGRREYVSPLESLLEIWTVLSTASEPLTPGQVGDRLEAWGMKTSSTTATRRLEDAVKHINTICTHTVLCEEGKPTILHTYPHDGALHVVVEDTLGQPLWTGNMTAVFQESSVNPVSQPTLDRSVPEMEQHFTKMKKSAKKQAVTDSSEAARKDPRAEENAKFKMDYPPISLEAIVETTKNGKKVVLTRQEYEKWQETLPPPPEMAADEQDDEEQDADKQKKQPEGDKKQKATKQKKQSQDDKEQDADEPKVETQNRRSPPRRFYLKSILSPEEWQLLTDMILVYPYISERETDKLLSAMARIAPGSRQWNKLVYAPKTPDAVRFDFIRKLEDAIQKQHKVSIQYGRYKLGYQLGGWKPRLQDDGQPYHVAHPYALTWSNGYYYLVCSVEKKDAAGQVYQVMRNFRVDRIRDVKTTTISFDKPANFDVYKYRDRSPVMYPGEVSTIKLRCHLNLLSVLNDFFGNAISGYSDLADAAGNPLNKIDDEGAVYATVTVEASENGTKLFALQYVDQVEVLEPKSLRDDIAKTLKTAVEQYL